MRGTVDLRKILRSLAAQTFGTAEHNPRDLAYERASEMQTQEHLDLPEIPMDPVQVLDPLDPDFGKFIFMLGYDTLGGDSVVLYGG